MRKIKRLLRFISVVVVLYLLISGADELKSNINLEYVTSFFQEEKIEDVTSELTEIFDDILAETKELTPPLFHKESENGLSGDNILHVEYIDVGQGDSILIYDDELENVMLIDTGVYREYNQLVAYLSEAGIEQIDTLMLTHPDSDHIGSADYILHDYDVDKVLVPDCDSDSDSYWYYQKALEETGAEEIIVSAGDIFMIGDAELLIIAPESDNMFSNSNSHSIVAKLTYGSSSFLFTGDATGEETDIILQKGYDVKADFYKVSHHGSANDGCNDPTFIKEVGPAYAVISCGYNNHYGHPHKETVEFLSVLEVFRTDTHGTIYVDTDGELYSIRTSK